MQKEKILVVEDEASIRELVSYNLEKSGFEVQGVASGEEGLRAVEQQKPSLLLLDLMLPGMDGLEVCKRLKESSNPLRQVPIVMMSARGEEADIIKGLELGADDYITKPFSPKILIARLNAVLRRATQVPADGKAPIASHGISIDPIRFEAKAGDSVLPLTATEFRILHFLARHPGWVFTRYQIVDAVKGENYAVTERAVDVQIVGLRKKLGEHGVLIETVRGVGYRYKE